MNSKLKTEPPPPTFLLLRIISRGKIALSLEYHTSASLNGFLIFFATKNKCFKPTQKVAR